MTDISPALSMAQSILKAISETAEELKTAADRYTADLRILEKELIAAGAVVSFTMAEPILQTERRFTSDREDCASDIAWCLGFRCYGPDEAWRITVLQYHREYDPISTHAAVRILRSETPLTDASREIRMAAMDHIIPFLQTLHDTLRQKLVRTKMSFAPSPARALNPRATPGSAARP